MRGMKLGGIPLVVAVVLLVLLNGSIARAQVTKERMDETRAKLQAAESLYNKLSPVQRRMLSGSTTNFFHAVENWDRLERKALAMQKTLGANRHPPAELAQEVPTTSGPV